MNGKGKSESPFVGEKEEMPQVVMSKEWQFSVIMLAAQWLFIKILDGIHRFLKTAVHYLLRLVYWSEGQKVPSVEDPILQMSATELAEQIREGKLTSENVMQAFIRRILIVNPIINAIHERRFDKALEEAREVDALIKSGKVDKSQLAKEKPLLGVPLTMKTMLTCKGMKKTCGSLLFKDEVAADEDAPVVALMKKAGAIVIANTNMPDLGCGMEASNRLIGTTCNPYDTNRTSGGSSGGEAALLASAGSVIGLGNDLLGSIRIPCMFCGVFGHKPSRGLVSAKGCFFPAPENTEDFFSMGPLCRYAQDLVTAMKILAPPNNMMEQKVNFEELKVYYFRSLGPTEFVDEVDEDIRQCMEKVASYFKTKHGSKVKEVGLPFLNSCLGILPSKALSLVPNLGRVLSAGRTDINGPKELIKFLFRQSQFTMEPILSLTVFKYAGLIYTKQLRQYYEKQAEEVCKKFDNMLDENSVLIMPTVPFPATYHSECLLHVADIVYYCAPFTLTGYPVTQCPVGFNPKGLPLGVQIVGRMGNDHLTIACAAELEKAFGGWKPPN